MTKMRKDVKELYMYKQEFLKKSTGSAVRNTLYLSTGPVLSKSRKYLSLNPGW